MGADQIILSIFILLAVLVIKIGISHLIGIALIALFCPQLHKGFMHLVLHLCVAKSRNTTIFRASYTVKPVK